MKVAQHCLRRNGIMYKIAIVEDDKAAAETLRGYLTRYGEEKKEDFHVSLFENGMQFLRELGTAFDIVFMDIEMPTMDGMETAELMRRSDDVTCLIFVTNMAQYAIKGYEVNALDFLLKPVSYPIFAFKLAKALSTVKKRSDDEIVIKTKAGLIRLVISDIYYLESFKHKVLYHTAREVVECWSTLAQEERKLLQHGFIRCHTSFLVNLRYVTKVENNTVFLGNVPLDLSRGKKTQFLNALTAYLGG